MNKIPFSIDKWPEIEAGKYEVVTRLDTPVKIFCYDARGKYPIAGLVRGEETDCPQSWRIDGSFDGRNESSLDLFLITPEPELSEFEVKLWEIMKAEDSPVGPREKFTNDDKRAFHEYSAELLELAKKELCESGEVTDWYAKGKAEALKDLPRWKKADRDLDAGTIDFAVFHNNDGGDHEDWLSVEVTNRLYKGEYYIELSALEKLPKEDKK